MAALDIRFDSFCISLFGNAMCKGCFIVEGFCTKTAIPPEMSFVVIKDFTKRKVSKREVSAPKLALQYSSKGGTIPSWFLLNQLNSFHNWTFMSGKSLKKNNGRTSVFAPLKRELPWRAKLVLRILVHTHKIRIDVLHLPDGMEWQKSSSWAAVKFYEQLLRTKPKLSLQ